MLRPATKTGKIETNKNFIWIVFRDTDLT